MADQWQVTRDEKKSGPFSSTALRRLAVSGKLLPSDQIWKEGMTKSVPASNLKGLFSDASSLAPSPSFSPNPSPPPVSSLTSVPNQHSGETAQPASPAPGHSFLERAKAGAADLAAKAKAAAQLASNQAEKTAQAAPTAAQSFAANMKAAGQLVVKQAERTKIVQVTLTTAYFALGKSLYAAGNLRGEFPDAFKAVDDLLNATKAVDAQAAGRTTGDGLTAKAKAAGQAAMDMAQKKKLQVQSNYALSTLGKMAFEKLGEQCGSLDLIRPISDAQSRLDTLDADITRLSESKSGGATAKRIAVGGLAFVALILLVGGLGFLSSGDSAFRQDSNGQSSRQIAASSGAKTATFSAARADKISTQDFEELPNGTKMSQVIAAVGQPNQKEPPPGILPYVTWYYDNVTWHVNGQLCEVRVFFDKHTERLAIVKIFPVGYRNRSTNKPTH